MIKFSRKDTADILISNFRLYLSQTENHNIGAVLPDKINRIYVDFEQTKHIDSNLINFDAPYKLPFENTLIFFKSLKLSKKPPYYFDAFFVFNLNGKQYVYMLVGDGEEQLVLKYTKENGLVDDARFEGGVFTAKTSISKAEEIKTLIINFSYIFSASVIRGKLDNDYSDNSFILI